MADAQVVWMDADQFDLEHMFSLSTRIPSWRSEKIKQIKPEEGKRLQLAAAILFTDWMRSIGRDPLSEEITFGKNGKPYLKNGASDAPLYFNLSHSGHYAVLASCASEVGVDIEQTCRYRETIARRAFHAQEQALLFSAAEPERPDLFCRIWTAKEACIKATGAGLSCPLEQFSTVNEEGRLKRMAILEGRAYRLEERPAPDGYHITVCFAR